MLKSQNECIRVLKGFPPHIENEFGLRENKPEFLGIHMKPICNFRCRKCFIGEQKDLKGKARLLSVNEMKKILHSAKSNGVKVLGITGAGEPFMDKRIYHIIEEASNNGFIIHIPTNSSLLNKEKINFLLKNNCTLILSLDTTNPESFAKKTYTSEKMHQRVMKNIMMAQEIYSGTKVRKRVNNKYLEVYRMAIHMTLQKGEIEEIDRIKEITAPDTLFSVSPLAETGFAIHNDIAVDFKSIHEKEITEKHIVICKDQINNKEICGFFRFGIDINFDGQLLLDAHALQTRALFKNIRDFEYSTEAAYLYLSDKKDFFAKNWMDGFCPVRSRKLGEWIELTRENKN